MKIRSMTGFAKIATELDGLSATAEIRSVNHRHLEARIMLPKSFSHLEEGLKKVLKNELDRGKVDCQITLEVGEDLKEKLQYNPQVFKDFMGLRVELEKELGPLPVTMGDLMQVKGLMEFKQIALDEEKVAQLFHDTVAKAATGLVEMRAREGELLAVGMLERLGLMKKLILQVPQYREEVIEAYKKRIQSSIEMLGSDYDPKDPKILQEVGIFIDKSDITEEIDRFHAHLTHFEELMNLGEPVGRKLDFLLQEFNREANTLCSKASHAKIAEIGVSLKVEIEKIREQVQNIE
ncbi:MAG: YicC/YloC family endoribonuclease [SAR324 cluster bacterium]|nr:YicC/YloC family endoribonuclease [SAR324 cluster bacterium]